MSGRPAVLAFVAGCLAAGGSPGPRRLSYRDPTLTREEHARILRLLRDLGADKLAVSEAAQKVLFGMGPVVVRYAMQLLGPEETRERVRLAAARAVIHNATSEHIEELVRLLEDSHPLVRHDAAVALKRLTGLTFGFDHRAPAEERKAVVLKWKQWLRLQR